MTRKELKDRFTEIVQVFKTLYLTEEGKKALEILEEEALFSKPTGVQSHEQYAYLAGKRDFFLWIHDICTISDEDLQAKIENLEKF